MLSLEVPVSTRQGSGICVGSGKIYSDTSEKEVAAAAEREERGIISIVPEFISKRENQIPIYNLPSTMKLRN